MKKTSDVGVEVANGDYFIKRDFFLIIGAFWFVYISNDEEGWEKDGVRVG